MLKFVKKLVIVVIVLLVLIFIGITIFLNGIKYEVTSDDIPQDVYDTSGDLLAFAKLKTLDLITANDTEKYTITEEILNLIILDSIHQNINNEYSPLGDCSTDSCLNVFNTDEVFIDYVFAKINDDNQIVITISFGFSYILKADTALMLVFDLDFDLISLEPKVEFTLNSYSLGSKDLSMSLLNFIFDRMNKTDIEDSITFGSLNLTDYTYTISILDAMEGD